MFCDRSFFVLVLFSLLEGFVSPCLLIFSQRFPSHVFLLVHSVVFVFQFHDLAFGVIFGLVQVRVMSLDILDWLLVLHLSCLECGGVHSSWWVLVHPS
jgi:hypothetical protein